MEQMTAMFSRPRMSDGKKDVDNKPRLLEGEIGGPRKVDVFAVEGSLADRLRKRRIETEQRQEE
jgi:hypothetical protein